MASECSNRARGRALEVYKNAMNSNVFPDGESLKTSVLMSQHSSFKRHATEDYLRKNRFADRSEQFPVVDEVKEQLEQVSKCMRELTPCVTEFLLPSKNCNFQTNLTRQFRLFHNSNL